MRRHAITGPQPVSLEARFWLKVERGEPDDCWEWTASVRANGYGQVYRGGGRGRGTAHRVSWELAHGAVPPGACVLHRCDNRRCVNPAHLFLGSVADNNADMTAKGRAHRMGGPSMPGEVNPSARLNAEAVGRIRAAHAAGATMTDLAAEYGVARKTVSKLVNRLTWQHVA